MTATAAGGAVVGFGEALRGWRRHRGLSQLDLSLEAQISPRHVSFLETGRSSPSHEMVLRLLDTLEVPLWDRNRLLLAAGYAPVYTRSSLDDDNLAQVRRVVRQLLERHEPYPAFAIDGAWNVVDANDAYRAAVDSIEGDAAERGNVLHLLCAPHLLRSVVLNWKEVMSAVFRRVRRQLDAPHPPPALASVIDQLLAFPDVESLLKTAHAPQSRDLFVPVTVRQGEHTLRWITTLMTFSGAQDIALDELVIECFFPADPETEKLAGNVGVHAREGTST